MLEKNNYIVFYELTTELSQSIIQTRYRVKCKRHGIRGIAQSGSAPALGAGCRGFKSLYPDQIFYRDTVYAPVAHLDRAPAF